MDLIDAVCDGMDYNQLAPDMVQWQALVNTNEPSGSVKGSEMLD
jgi:hypothetical protein